uniref:Uncharacterized protein n=1 Tax=viral metagenome TaxID=1070528 RepID=A0A6C0DT81_9ZZZZ
MPAKIPTVGSKACVYHGTALRTAGGLKKEDLMRTDKGRIVSKKQHASGLQAIKRLRAAGFVAKKGEFKLFSRRSGSKKVKSPSRRVTRSMSAARTASRKVAAAKAAATRRARKLATIKEGGRRRSTRRSFW